MAESELAPPPRSGTAPPSLTSSPRPLPSPPSLSSRPPPYVVETPSPPKSTKTGGSQCPHPPVLRIRWVGVKGGSPDAEWVEDADDLIPRIRATLLHVLPSVYPGLCPDGVVDMTVEFMAQGAWNRIYTVRLLPPLRRPSETRFVSPPTSPVSSSPSSSSLSRSPISSPVILPSPSTSFTDSPRPPVCPGSVPTAAAAQSLDSCVPPKPPTLLATDLATTELIMRVALPACPTNKTESEVATLQWVRHHTSIPVPEVYAYDSSDRNTLGYEWILMERMPGESYATAEDKMGSDARITLARTLADWVDSLSRHSFPQIGSLYPSRTGAAVDATTLEDNSHQHRPPKGGPTAPSPMNCTTGTCRVSKTDKSVDWDQPTLGPLVFQSFFGDWRLQYSFDRGPYNNLHDFALACSAVGKAEVFDPRQEQRSLVDHLEWLVDWDDLEGDVLDAPSPSDFYARRAQEKMDKESETEKKDRHERLRQNRADLQAAIAQVSCLQGPVSFDHTRYSLDSFQAQRASTEILDEVIDAIKPRSSLPNTNVLVHWDISRDNVLVHPETGQPTALLDWEHIITIPLSVVAYYPRLLQDAQALEFGSIYSDDSEDESEQCQMRRAFDQRLQELESPWLDVLGIGEDDNGDTEEEEEEEGEDPDKTGDSGGVRDKEHIDGENTEEELIVLKNDRSTNVDHRQSSSPVPSRRLLRMLFGELRHSFHSPKNIDRILREVKDELQDSG